MELHVYRVQRFNEEPEKHCIIGTAPSKKVRCGYSELLQRVGTAKFSAQNGSFDGACNTIQVKVFDPNQNTKCCR